MKPIKLLFPQINTSLWNPLMFGASWINEGTCYEYGMDIVTEKNSEFYPGIHTRLNQGILQAEVISSLRHDGTNCHYTPVDKIGYVCWEGREFRNDFAGFRIKHHDSSRWFNNRILSMDWGESYEMYNICPVINYCVGHAHYDDSDEVEIFFMCTQGLEYLNQIAAYYNLPVPYGPQHMQVLSSDPKLYRAGHFDLFKAGPGMFIPLVLASITFISNKPARLLLYTFQRPWEFEDSLDIDYF